MTIAYRTAVAFYFKLTSLLNLPIKINKFTSDSFPGMLYNDKGINDTK